MNGPLKIDREQVVYAIYMLNDGTDQCTFVSAHPSMDAARMAREDLSGYDGVTGPIILPVRLTTVPASEVLPSEWIGSRSIEHDPQQLVGHRVEMASKNGGGWRGTIPHYGASNYTLTDGEQYGFAGSESWRPIAHAQVGLYDIARARIIKEQ